MIDLRRPEHRRATFQRFYAFHLTHKAHPGAVYLWLPYLAETEGWTPEQAAWFAFLNGNTQNPATSWVIFQRAPHIGFAHEAIAFVNAHHSQLAWDTDRRHHKKMFAQAVHGYLNLTSGHQVSYWRRAGSWGSAWAKATAIPSFGRLSAWSYLEYLHILGLMPYDADHLMLADRDGSRSHRNGLAIIAGRDDLDWHPSNPGFDGRYTPDDLHELNTLGESLLAEAKGHGLPATRLTLESALCTYKSWHRPRRRYPNVYHDMAHDRLRAAETRWPDINFDAFWQARRDHLPPRLRLEDNPFDPGVHPDKQDQYRLTGRPPMMEDDYRDMASPWPDRVAAQEWGRCR